MFGVEGADERGVVEAAVEALREGLGEKGALVVAAFAQTVGMERNGDDDIDFGEGELCAHRPLQEVHQVLAKPGRPVELEVLDQLADGALVEKCAAGACVVRRFLLAGLADERMVDRRGDGRAADAARAAGLVEGKGGEAARAEMPSGAVGRARTSFDRADAWPHKVGKPVEDAHGEMKWLTT